MEPMEVILADDGKLYPNLSEKQIEYIFDKIASAGVKND